jgi:hypothetical protein
MEGPCAVARGKDINNQHQYDATIMYYDTP